MYSYLANLNDVHNIVLFANCKSFCFYMISALYIELEKLQYQKLYLIIYSIVPNRKAGLNYLLGARIFLKS